MTKFWVELEYRDEQGACLAYANTEVEATTDEQAEAIALAANPKYNYAIIVGTFSEPPLIQD